VTGGIELRSLAGCLAFPPGGEPRFRLDVERLVIRLYEEAVEALIRRSGQALPLRIRPGELLLKTEVGILVGSVPVEARLAASATSDGLLRLELVGLKASFLTVSPSLVAGHLEQKLRGKPGVARASGTSADIDLGGLLKQSAAVVGAFPPLKSVQLGEGWAELEYAAAREEPV
jgi:hypothetical protein